MKNEATENSTQSENFFTIIPPFGAVVKPITNPTQIIKIELAFCLSLIVYICLEKFTQVKKGITDNSLHSERSTKMELTSTTNQANTNRVKLFLDANDITKFSAENITFWVDPPPISPKIKVILQHSGKIITKTTIYKRLLHNNETIVRYLYSTGGAKTCYKNEQDETLKTSKNLNPI